MLSELLKQPYSTKARMVLGSDIDNQLIKIIEMHDQGYTVDDISIELKKSSHSSTNEPSDITTKLKQLNSKYNELAGWDITISTYVANKLYRATDIRNKEDLKEAITNNDLLPGSYKGKPWEEYAFFGKKCLIQCCEAVGIDPNEVVSIPGKADDGPIEACPHCGLKTGYYRKFTTTGTSQINYKFDGSVDDNSHMYEDLNIKEQLTMFCQECGEKISTVKEN